MNIFFDGRVLSHKTYSGVENYVDFILKALKSKASVYLVKPVSANKYIQQLWEHFILPFLVSKNDLLFCPANLAPLCLSKKTKLVLTLHDVAYKTFPDSVSKAFYQYYSFVVPRNIRRADQIITISEASKQEIIQFYPEAEEKITVIYHGIHEKYRVLPEIQRQKQILYVGSINDRKNVAGMIEAFEILSEELGYTLVIIGNFFCNFSLSEKTDAVLKRAVLNKNIVFKQGLDDEALIQEYNAASCFVFPSFYEGFGLPPLEAMACGTPVIVSNLSSMPEVCGDAALYVDPYDIEAMAQVMQRVLESESLRNELTVKGLEHVRQFTWEKAVQKHLAVFEKVLAK